MIFKENINRICRERGTYLTSVIKSLGISASKVTAINNGSIPKEEVMVAMAKVLDCSVTDFFANEKEKPCLSEDEIDMLRIYNRLDRIGQHKLMSAVYDFDIKE